MSIVITKSNHPNDIQKCQNLRKEVFVVGQNVPIDIEIDGLDDQCDHYMISISDAQIGTARIRPIDDIAKIERVAILNSHRGMGMGKKLMLKIINDLQNAHKYRYAKLGAQMHAIPFYESMGFQVCGEKYMDAGIPHKDMILTL